MAAKEAPLLLLLAMACLVGAANAEAPLISVPIADLPAALTVTLVVGDVSTVEGVATLDLTTDLIPTLIFEASGSLGSRLSVGSVTFTSAGPPSVFHSAVGLIPGISLGNVEITVTAPGPARKLMQVGGSVDVGFAPAGISSTILITLGGGGLG